MADQFAAAHAWHDDVSKQQVDVIRATLEQLDRFRPARRFQDVKPQPLEHVSN